MTKQEEIREGIEGMQFMPDEFEVFEGSQTWSIRPSAVKKILNNLRSQGVVIKVERELPSTYLGWRRLEKKTKKMPDYGGGMFEDNVASVQDEHTKKVLLKAGYVAVEPLTGGN